MKSIQLILIFVLLGPIAAICQSNNTQLFKSKEQSFVVKADPIDLDSNNTIIIIPGGRMFRKFFETIDYFKNVETYDTFIKGVHAANITEDNGEPIRSDGYRKYYQKYTHFLVFEMKFGKENLVQLSLLKPDTGDIFIVNNKSQTSLVGITAGTTQVMQPTWNSMMNEFVNYIRANSKTYDK